MNTEDALKILTALAQGIDPSTGELIDDDHILSNPHVIRALFTSINALNEKLTIPNNSPPSSTRSKDTPASAGKSWTSEEEQQLISEFNQAQSISDIAKIHNRSKGAISSRLFRLGLIQDRSNF